MRRLTTTNPGVTQASRYIGRLDGRLVGVIEFALQGDTVLVTHTGTEPAFRGRGIAGQLTTFALDDIRARGQRVRPLCPYTAAFVDDHPEYHDLLA